MPVVIVGEVATRYGTLVLIRREGAGLELFLDGRHLMSSAEARSEDDLARLARARWAAGGRPPRCLVLGFGLGQTVSALTKLDADISVVVVELFQPLLGWLGEQPETAGILADPRVTTLVADASTPPLGPGPSFDIVLLDVGNGPLDPVLARNESLYALEGLTSLRDLLLPGGVLGAWAAEGTGEFEAALREVFGNVEAREIALDTGRPDLEPDVVYLSIR